MFIGLQLVGLSELKPITSWGIDILIQVYTTVTNASKTFFLAAVPEHIKETFQTIKIDSVFIQFSSVEEALNS